MAISKKTIFAINAFVLTIGIAIGAYFFYKHVMRNETFCSYSDFDISKTDNLILQPPYPEDAFSSNSGDYKAYLHNETADSIVGVNQHPQDSSSNPVKFVEF